MKTINLFLSLALVSAFGVEAQAGRSHGSRSLYNGSNPYTSHGHTRRPIVPLLQATQAALSITNQALGTQQQWNRFQNRMNHRFGTGLSSGASTSFYPGSSLVWNPNNWYQNYANYYRYTPYYQNGVQTGGAFFPTSFYGATRYPYSSGYGSWGTNNSSLPLTGGNYHLYGRSPNPFQAGSTYQVQNQTSPYSWSLSGTYRPGQYTYPTNVSLSNSGQGANGGSWSYSLNNGQLSVTGTGPGGTSVTYNGSPYRFNLSGSSPYPWY